MENRRITAQKTNAFELVRGKYVKRPGFESNYVLTNMGRRLSRIRLVGLVVDKYVSEEGNYAAITLDDESDTIRCKAFMNMKIFDSVNAGDLVDVVGKVREYNGEIYLMPEIIRKVDPNFEVLRMLEIAKTILEQKKLISKISSFKSQVADLSEIRVLAKQEGIKPAQLDAVLEAEEVIRASLEQQALAKTESRSKILGVIESMDKGEGVDYNVILRQSGLAEENVDSTIQELLESGTCFEPKPGKIKKV